MSFWLSICFVTFASDLYRYNTAFIVGLFWSSISNQIKCMSLYLVLFLKQPLTSPWHDSVIFLNLGHVAYSCPSPPTPSPFFSFHVFYDAYIFSMFKICNYLLITFHHPGGALRKHSWNPGPVPGRASATRPADGPGRLPDAGHRVVRDRSASDGQVPHGTVLELANYFQRS